MKNVFAPILLAVLLFTGLPAFAGPTEFGTLKVLAEETDSEIYVDGKLAGKDRVVIDKIEAGEHMVRVKKGGEFYFSKLAEIKANEITSVIPSKGAAAPKEEPKAESATKREVKKRLNLQGFSIDLDITNAAYNQSGTAISASPAMRYSIGASFRLNDPISKMLNSQYDWILELGYKTSLAAMTVNNPVLGSTNITQSPLYLNDLLAINESFFWGFGVNYSMATYKYGTVSASGTPALGYQLIGGMQVEKYLVRLEYVIQNSNYLGATDTTSGMVVTGSYSL